MDKCEKHFKWYYTAMLLLTLALIVFSVQTAFASRYGLFLTMFVLIALGSLTWKIPAKQSV